VKLAINGLGRIGRLVLRQLVLQKGVEVVGVNDVMDIRTLAHLIKYDSVHGRAPFSVSCDKNSLLLAGQRIQVFREQAPGASPFAELGAQMVLECTGMFATRPELTRFLHGSVSHVLVSMPVEDADLTLVMGVNHETFDVVAHRIISNASSTANCLAPMIQVLDEAFGLEYGLYTAIHAYANDQRILDLPHKDLRLARAASLSMIPTSSDAANAIDLVLPHLAGRLDGLAVRVPTPDVSITDLAALLTKEATVASINAAFRKAAVSGSLKGYLEVVEDEIVSMDLTGNPASCIFDPFLTRVMTPRYVKVFGWYDNEYGYATRMKDLAIHMLQRIEEEAR
jgi:glyceraldehyde 3-phosphate dehydrogenase